MSILFHFLLGLRITFSLEGMEPGGREDQYNTHIYMYEYTKGTYWLFTRNEIQAPEYRTF